MPTQTTQPDTRSLWVAAVSLLLLTAAASFFGGFIFVGLDDSKLATGLTNIATIGGVAAGLSLAGTAVLTLTGDSVGNLVQRYGRWIRWILFGGYFATVSMSLLAGIGAVFANQPWIPWLASTSAACIFSGLLVTALFINSAFRWHHWDQR